MPKVMQEVIEQHFPSVSEAASIKVDKVRSVCAYVRSLVEP